MQIAKNLYVEPDVWSTKKLYQLYTQEKIVVMPEWLQRLMQKKKWNKNKGERIKSYLYHYFTGCSLIQPFYIVKISVLKAYLNKNIHLQTNEEVKNIYKDILEDIEYYENETGAEYVLLDGQNRLELCLKPFFEGSLKNNTYAKPFEIIKDGKREMLNNFIFTDIQWTEKEKDAFWNTEVLVVEGMRGDLLSYVKSLQNLNDAEPWSQFERDIIEFTPLTYNINKLTCKDANIQSLFGNAEMEGHVKDMSGNYLLEKKGDARMIAEFVNYVFEKGKSGFGTEPQLSEIINDSLTKSNVMDSYKRVEKYLRFISTQLLCVKNRKLDKDQKPFNKESLRGVIILLDILTNGKNNYHQMSPIQVKFKNIKKGKQLIEDFIKWHNEKTCKFTTPEDFEQGEPRPGTYVIGTRTIATNGVENRSLKIVEQFIVENQEKWEKEHYFSEQVDNYKQYKQLLLKENNYIDEYTGKKIRLRDKLNTDHVMATNGPNNGTNDVENLVVTNSKTNKMKSNSV